MEAGVTGSTVEGLEAFFAVVRPGLPQKIRHSLAYTDIIENSLYTVCRVTGKVKTLAKRQDSPLKVRRRPAGGPEDLAAPQRVSQAVPPTKRALGAPENDSGQQRH